MFEKFLRANAGDFRQRYEGTFGFFRDERGGRTLAKIDGISDTVCSFVNAKGVSFSLNVDTDKDIGFEFIPPKSQFHNTDDAVFLVRRVAARQFQRGVTGKNVEIYRLVGNTLTPQRVDFPVLSKIYENSRTAQEVVSRLTKEGMEKNGLALTGPVAFGRAVVYVYERLVGEYTTEDYKHFKVRLDEPDLWRTEVTDALRSINKTVEIS